MSVSIQATFEKLSVKGEEPTCPITLAPFTRPWILLEDGFTYEKSAIEAWLKSKPNTSPMLGEIPSATLLPNCAVKRKTSECPITKEPFQEAYYCVEDGHTYEKDAILKWFEVEIHECIEQEISPLNNISSPVSGTELNSLTLYPNKILFDKGIPQEQKPTIYKVDINKIVSEAQSETDVKCIFDSKIRDLITSYVNEKSSKLKTEIKQRIHEQRTFLGLNIRKTFYETLDLSHLDLSNMNLDGLVQKGSLFKETNLSNSVLKKCDLSRCRFISCIMQKTVFINCSFIGEEVSFFKTDMKDAVIEARCSLEKGRTWKRIDNWDDFKAELSRRGAINVDTVTLRNLSL